MSAESKEKCGVFGVYGHGHDVARETFFGLFALQHRGQESAGIVTSNGYELSAHKEMGLVTQAFREQDIDYLEAHGGFMAVGHVRYATSKDSTIDYCQPLTNEGLVFAHNGNLPITNKLEEFSSDKNIPYVHSNDSGMMSNVLNYYIERGAGIEDAIAESSPLFTGAYSLLMMSKDKLVAFRDQCGIRPLSLGKLNSGYVIASETCAFDTVGATFIRDVEPGEMLVISEDGIKSHQLLEPNPKLDIFEFVYFARPDSMLLGQRVFEVRQRLGMLLAKEAPANADIVVGVPDSGIPMGLGYAKTSGLEFAEGLIKNRYIHRTFIQPEGMRKQDAELKYNIIPEVVKGKRVVVVDDSIVRGTTQETLVKMFKRAGAKEVHIRIASPPDRYPGLYGIDTPTQHKLIAARMSVEQIKDFTGADSLQFLSYDSLIAATGMSEDYFDTSCFTGIYPIDIGHRAREFQLV